MSVTKSELRKKYKLIRSEEGNPSEADWKIMRLLIDTELYKNADVIFSYFSIGSEVDTLNIIKYSLESGKKVALPVCVDADGRMDFYLIDDFDSLCEGMYSIKEPDINSCQKAVSTERSLCLVPALAFDKKGYRLGYGKGYYDRFSESFYGFSVGLCRSSCLCDTLPHEDHDKKVNVLITENAIYKL